MSSRALAVLMIGLSLFTAARADAGIVVSVEASPLSIPADGKSRSQVLVTVLDQTGSPVPDGAEVHLTTSAGEITPLAHTSGGRAIGILTSSDSAQIAAVSAISEGASGTVQVEFSPSSDSQEDAARYRVVRIAGGSLAYSVDRDTILGSSGVTIEYRGLTIKAAGARVCQTSGLIWAEGEASVRKGDQVLTAGAVACDLRGSQIRLFDQGNQSAARTLDVETLKPVSEKNAQGDARSFAAPVDVDSKTWIISERLVLIPGEKILFFKASVYVGDVKVISMPCYSYAYDRRESILQQIRYTSSDGILVDLPCYYYQMSDSRTGALKLRYAANGAETGGYGRPPRGLSLGLEHSYSLGDASHGRAFVDSVGTPGQAFELAHRLDYGSAATAGRADISARYQASSPYAKGIYTTTLNMAGILGSYNYSFFGYLGGSNIRQFSPVTGAYDYVSQSNSSFRAIYSPRSPIKSNALGRVTPSLTTGYATLWTASGKAVPSCLYETLGMSFNRSGSGRGTTDLGYSGGVGLTMTTRGETGASLRAGPTLRARWLGGMTSLGYTYNLQSGTTDAGSLLARHQLSCNVFMYGGRWNTNSSVSYGMDSRRLSLFSTLNYNPTGRLQVRCSYNLYRYAFELSGRAYSYGTSYTKAGIYHPIGPYEIGLAWSPDGQNYGIDRGKRLWLEFGGRGF